MYHVTTRETCCCPAQNSPVVFYHPSDDRWAGRSTQTPLQATQTHSTDHWENKVHSAVCTVTCLNKWLFKTLCKPNWISLSCKVLRPPVWTTPGVSYKLLISLVCPKRLSWCGSCYLSSLVPNSLSCTLNMSNLELLVVPWIGHVLLHLVFLQLPCPLIECPSSWDPRQV